MSGVYSTPYLKAANITWEGLDLSDLLEMDFRPEERALYTLEEGDLVLAEASGSSDQVGRPAIWRGEVKGCCFQNTVIRFSSSRVLSEYAYIVFRCYAETGEFGKVARGVGIQHLSAKRFGGMPFPLPPIEEQARIIEKVNTNLKRLARSLVLLDRARSKIETKKRLLLRTVIGGELIPDEGNLQEDWRIVSLGEICNAINGKTFRSSEWVSDGLPIIRIQNLKDSDAKYHYFTGEIEPRFLIRTGDLLFAWSGTPGTSFGAFTWTGPLAALNQHIFKIEEDTSVINRRYLFYALNALLDVFISRARGGGGLAHITKTDFLETRLAIAPKEKQEEITARLDKNLASNEKLLLHIEGGMRRIGALKHDLLKRAISGKLTTINESDTPARSLLGLSPRKKTTRKKLPPSNQLSLGITVQDGSPKTSDHNLRHSIFETLCKSGPLKAQDLLEGAGYNAEIADEVNQFYDELREAIRNREVEKIKDKATGAVLWRARNL